jgi:hypothetical protein
MSLQLPNLLSAFRLVGAGAPDPGVERARHRVPVRVRDLPLERHHGRFCRAGKTGATSELGAKLDGWGDLAN